MTVDALPILAYKVAEAQFDLAAGQSFISLRDQAVRVRTLLTAMHEAGLFSPHGDFRVLVVGAGYAGVSAALWLASKSIHTTLLDVEERAFAVQRGCSTRYLSLTQYDWPGRHHAVHDYPGGLAPNFIAYPWLQENPPPADHLWTWGIRRASEHARIWEHQLLHAVSAHTHLSWRPRTRLRPSSIRVRDGGIALELETLPTGRIEVAWFDYVFYATGFGTDEVEVRELSGGVRRTPGFWTDDTLSLRSVPLPPRILISGGGDGALQDFIRILVDPRLTTAGVVLEAIVAGMQSQLPSAGARAALAAVWAEAESIIEYAELQASNAAAWRGEQRPHIWLELHRMHQLAATKVASAWGDALFTALAYVAWRKHRCDELTVVFPGATAGRVYALNRFLFILLSEFFHYILAPSATFFGSTPRRPPHLPRYPTVAVLPQHRVDVATTNYDPSSGEYVAHVEVLNGGGSRTFRVDQLIFRHGTRKPQPLGIRVGLHRVGLELGRIRLPFVASD